MSTAEDTVLLCYDQSENAGHAIESAGRLLAPRHALVATIWQPIADRAGIPLFGEAASMVDFAQLDRTAAEKGDRVARDGVRIARHAGFDAEPLAVKAAGPVWKTILEIADSHDAAAIVMGSRGLTGIRSMLLGSVSSHVVHHAERPTLVVHLPLRG